MLACFEHWFGPYPWYDDGYKLVEAPHLGMEHQSAVAYGNHYQNGYLRARPVAHGAGAEVGLHHRARERARVVGQLLTSKDLADMWVHESFANYAEGLYTECQEGKAAGNRYMIGARADMQNDEPIIPAFGVNAEGSGDMYYKGGNMLHTIRQIVGDDEKWRGILRGLQHDFRHQTVTGSRCATTSAARRGSTSRKVFEQYLTTTQIPVLEWAMAPGGVRYRWANVVPGFDMPVRVSVGGTAQVLRPTTGWKTVAGSVRSPADFVVDENYYVTARNVAATAAR